MLIKCVKNVNKVVKKSAQKPCNLFVQNIQKVDKKCDFCSFTQVFNNKNEVLHFLINDFYTIKLINSSLLFGGFTLFPHRSTITTTLLINKEENF